MTSTCFTYGSLMCGDIMAWVTAGAPAGVPAHLPGHARHPVRDEDYPGAIADPAHGIEGVLYRNLDEAMLARLDVFEGEMYERRLVTVNPVGGGAEVAWCYIVRDTYRDRLLPGDWDFAAFLAEGKARFRARYMGFAALDRDD